MLDLKESGGSHPFSLIADFEGDIRELFKQEYPETMPLLPLRNMNLFPGVVAPVVVGRESSLRLIKQAASTGGFFAVGCQKDPADDDPTLKSMWEVGVVARVMREIEMPNGNRSVILQTHGRVRLVEQTQRRPFMRVRIEPLTEVIPAEGDKEYAALVDAVKDQTVQLLKISDTLPDDAIFAIKNISHPVFLVNFICTNLPFSQEEKQRLLQTGDQKERATSLLGILNREIQYATLKRNIREQTREDLDKQQKEYFLQQQIRNIQHELGDTPSDDAKSLREKAKQKHMDERAQAAFEKEVQKLERLSAQSPDYSVQLNYLETLVGLPWGEMTEDTLDIRKAQETLDRDHYGLEKVKERILEHLSILRLREGKRAPILCLYGPPGVGKTSLGRSIADALGRRYVRVSLGGIHDEAEIRGHRRTYIGAMPGRIIKSMQKAGTDNPVFILDEIDKVADSNHNGDPQSALLEVLDPEQNKAFHDNFLDLDYDLSHVFFIATANSLGSIPRPLLDRMELIAVEGYLTEEKTEIAKRHLLRKIQREIGTDKRLPLNFSKKSLEFLIEKYTRESGVRQLEKQLERIYGKMAYRVAMGEQTEDKKISITPKVVEELLGKPPYNRDIYQGNRYAGVVTGLAWTAVGGEILFIETSLSRSKTPKLTLTGNLGDVMKESAILALEYVKSHASTLGLDYRVFDHWSVHIHVPEGATPKDGPSAGITIATSIASAFTQRKVRKNTAMTGEITLRGKVLPVGGIKEKILAAKRAGITDIILSDDNRKDIDEINAKYLDGLTFHFVESVDDVLRIALLDEKVSNALNIDVPQDEPKND